MTRIYKVTASGKSSLIGGGYPPVIGEAASEVLKQVGGRGDLSYPLTITLKGVKKENKFVAEVEDCYGQKVGAVSVSSEKFWYR